MCVRCRRVYFCIIELGHFPVSSVVKASGNLIAKWKFLKKKKTHTRKLGRRKERRENKWFPIPAAEFVNGLWILNRNIFQLSMFNEVQRICHHFHFAFLFNLSFFDGSFFVVARNSISTSLISVRRKLTTKKKRHCKMLCHVVAVAVAVTVRNLEICKHYSAGIENSKRGKMNSIANQRDIDLWDDPPPRWSLCSHDVWAIAE